VSTLAVGAALFIILMSPIAANALGSTVSIKLQRPLSEFPKQFEDWKGRSGTMDDDIWKRVGGQSYTIINYQALGKPSLNFYTAYYEYQRKGGDFIHSPKLCMPGAGWHIDSARVRTLARRGADQEVASLKFNDLVMSKSGQYQLVYYWFQGRDRNFTSEYAAKFYMVWDGIFRRRTDGALVRLVMPLPSKETVPKVRKEMDRFAVFASNTLDQFLP
jgi:EpsI family protein